MAAYKHPHVRGAVESGAATAMAQVEPVRAVAASASSAAWECMEQVSSGQVASSLGTFFGEFPSCLPRPRPSIAASISRAADAPGDSRELHDEAALLPSEAHVRLRGLQAAKELNGRVGVVICFDCASGRYQVRVLPSGVATGVRVGGPTGASATAEQVKLIRRENLELVVLDATSAPENPEQFI